MEIDEEMNFLLQRVIQEADGSAAFVLDHVFTSRLKVGSFIKIVGFALGKDGVTVTDTEKIEVRHSAEYSLAFEKSYYILAREGLFMDIKKKQEKCPNPISTLQKLNDDDKSRLYCTLYSIERKLIKELDNCNVEEGVFWPGQ